MDWRFEKFMLNFPLFEKGLASYTHPLTLPVLQVAKRDVSVHRYTKTLRQMCVMR